jgi:hypothetical protein
MKIKFAVLALCSAFSLNAFNPGGKDIFGTRVFVQNNGQFLNPIDAKESIKYGFENGSEKIYFTTKGLIYQFVKGYPLSERAIEKLEQGKTVPEKPADIYYVQMNWADANADIQIEQSEKQSHSITYGIKELKSNTFKKITYKNVYNNIDIEYTIPDDKDYGIKYNLILHPGANVSDIKLIYSGDVNGIILKRDGSIQVKTPLEDITEHAPISFYSNNEAVASAFTLNNNAIGFNFPNGYDLSKTLVVDPWVTTITSLNSSNYGYDVDYDNSGNLFVYGGGGPSIPSKVACYNSSGVLQWTFSGIIITPSWNSGGNFPSNNYLGNFVVNRTNGKTYFGEGFNSTGSQIIRLDAGGNYDNFITNKLSTYQENWEMGYDCVSGNVFTFGGGTTSNQSGSIINQGSGLITPVAFVSSNPSAGQDISSAAIDDLGNIFVYYSGSGMGNQIGILNSAFSGTVTGTSSTYSSFIESTNKNNFVGSGIVGSSDGFNCLAINSNYLYFYDGFNLAAYNRSTLAKIGFTTVSTYTLKQQGGIAVDDCDNVYIGGNGSVLSYQFNGSVFSALPSFSLNALSSNQFVYDIKLDKNSNLLYVAGSGFVGTYSAVNSLSCSATSSCSGITTFISNSTHDQETISVIPNPNNGNFMISSNDNEIFDASIYNNLGQLIKFLPQNKSNVNVDLSEFSAGLYIVLIKKGGLNKSIKVIHE